MNHRILWVEDEATGDLADYVGPLLLAGYTVDIAESATEAISKLQEQTYDVVIFDLVINAGDAPEWMALDQENTERFKELNLGFQLLQSLFAPENARICVSLPPGRIAVSRTAVFTVVADPEVHRALEQMGIATIRVKALSSLTVLKQIVEELIPQ